MPAPIITNPYNNDNILTAYIGEPFSVKIAIANMGTPPRVTVEGVLVGWAYSWLADEEKVELFVTPDRPLKDLLTLDEATGLPITEKSKYTGLRMEAINTDGSDIAMIPFEFIHREPLINDLST